MKISDNTNFWDRKTGKLLLIAIVLLPSALLLTSGKLLLVGLGISLVLTFGAVFLQKKKWADFGFSKPKSFLNILLLAIIAVIVLMPISNFLKHYVTQLTHQAPNLEAFKTIKGNPIALLLGLVVAWIFGAFAEEFFFRGFLLNTIHSLFPTKLNDKLKWFLALLITSIFVGFGHTYQGPTGMIVTAILGFSFGLVYLFSKRNLWSSIFTHGLYDTVAFVMVFMGVI